nr:type II toxin-antitoxin system RelE/ParE family toxin [Mesorhizobium sp.]
MPYELSRQATNDLEKVYLDGLDRFGESQADDYIRDLRNVLDLIATNPRMARIRTEIDPPVRIHPHRSHMIVYRDQIVGVLILRIRHARENWAERPI